MALNPPYEYRATVTRVVDGDTIDVAIELGFYITARVRLRLEGIDAPETYGVSKTSNEYQAGVIAKDWLTDRIENQQVIVTTTKTGKYGRWLAIVTTENNTNINAEMLELGLASAYE